MGQGCYRADDRHRRPVMDTADIKELVRARYGEIASSCCAPAAPSCCAPSKEMGYAAADLAALPDGADLGLGCGNPGAIAALKPGEVVVDLGSGAGIDCFMAAQAVGPTGRVIGVDMTHEMLKKARANAAKNRRRQRRIPARLDRASPDRR